MLLCAAMLLAVCFVINKLYQKQAGTSLEAGLVYNSLLGIFAAIIFFFIGGFKFEVTAFSVIMATAMTVVVMAYTLLGFRILKNGSVAIYSIFLMSGGMTVPYIYGLLFLDEEFSWLRTVGLVVLISAVAISNFGGKGEKNDIKRLAMCICVFLLNGCVSVISKVHQVESVRATVGAEQFVMLAGIAKFIIGGVVLGVLLLISKHSTASSKNDEIKESAEVKPKLFSAKSIKIILPLIVIAAAVDGVSYFLQLKGAANLPATVLYPMITGASMIFSAVADFAVFKQKPTRFVVISVALCFAGTLMFL
ncbi:MAG: hypothetical protein IJD79_00980 [Clostridia bacterium]|nr:hypothetical protein [Clostridia bacterium]